MANKKQIALLKEGVSRWNAWREHHPHELVDLSEADLSKADLSRAKLSGANLSGANLSDAKLSVSNLSRANLSMAKLSRANLNRTDLSRADLSGVDLSDAYLSRAYLSDATLSDAILINANLSDAILINADLGRANLRKADLSRVDLSDADLSRVDLSDAGLSRAKLSNIKLSRANLRKADLSGADLSGADLSDADLGDANLGDVNLSRANLGDAKLSGVYLWKTTIDHVDLRTVRGLSTIIHRGPSAVVLHTVQLPEDGSASLFLKGCGVPDEWIDDYRARMMHPIQYYSVFLSYSAADDLLAKRLHADLQDHGVRCWFAPHDLVPGDFFRQKIDQAIQQQDRLLLILSKHSVNSKWVTYEVNQALDREIHQERTILFPIRIDDAIEYSRNEWAKALRSQRHIGDFTQWSEPQRYQDQLKTLLTNLKNEE